jgi:hypothetical protein
MLVWNARKEAFYGIGKTFGHYILLLQDIMEQKKFIASSKSENKTEKMTLRIGFLFQNSKKYIPRSVYLSFMI